MTSPDTIAVRAPDGPVFRLARVGAVWSWPDWAYAGDDGTWGHRFDDAEGNFRILYASSQRVGAFLETLARLRPDPHVVAATIADDEEDTSYPTAPAGLVPARWTSERAIASATLIGSFVELGHSATLAYLREALAPRLLHYRLDDLDASTIRLKAPRRLTQEIASHLYALADEDGQRRFDGIAYSSRLGDEITNWAIWEPATQLESHDEESIGVDDPDFVTARERFGLVLAPTE